MNGFDPADAFGPEVAARYDDQRRGDEEAAVGFLAGLAQGGRALEFAVGTGRIALPLAAAGVEVDGIEISPHMVEQLRAKPGGERIGLTMGDMSTAATGRRYDLVYLVYNTIFNVLTADGQIRCFQNAARHLAADGRFVVEAFLPHACIPPGETDLMARIAGLRLVERFSNWQRTPFDADSRAHVSVYAPDAKG